MDPSDTQNRPDVAPHTTAPRMRNHWLRKALLVYYSDQATGLPEVKGGRAPTNAAAKGAYPHEPMMSVSLGPSLEMDYVDQSPSGCMQCMERAYSGCDKG